MKLVGKSLFIVWTMMLMARRVMSMASKNTQQRAVLVTGANSGIGLALCKQLVTDHDCKVYLGARNKMRGEEAVQAVKEHAAANSNIEMDDASVELVIVDVASDESVQHAAQTLKSQGVKLHAIVNNAGRGFAHNASPEEIVNVNLLGTKRVVDHFLPLLEKSNQNNEYGMPRIVNVGSGGGANYVSDQVLERRKLLCSSDITWEQIEELALGPTGLASCKRGGYGLSKALVHSYTQVLAREHPDVLCVCLSPGFVQTAMTVGTTAKMTPEEGTKSLKHCILDATPEQSGWYFGSDCKRSPLHFMRNGGELEFDGIYPWEKV